jgi:hypothetical protein
MAYESNPIAAVGGVSQHKMVFTESIVYTYSKPTEVNADPDTAGMSQIAGYAGAKSAMAAGMFNLAPGLNTLVSPYTDMLSEPALCCHTNCFRGEGSTVEYIV